MSGVYSCSSLDRVYLRGHVFSTPKFYMNKGKETMKMVLAVRGRPNVPAAINTIYDQPHYASTVPIFLTGERALQAVNNLGTGSYVHKLIGRFAGNVMFCKVFGISLDLTDCDKQIDEYEPENKAQVRGLFGKEIAFDEIKGIPCSKFIINVSEKNNKGYDEEKAGGVHYTPVKIKCYADEAIHAHEALKKGMEVYCEGMINTWRMNKIGKQGRRPYDWSVISNVLEF